MRFNKNNIETFYDVFCQLGMSIKEFSERFGIPYRTVQDWKLGNYKCPSYVLSLFVEYFDRELNSKYNAEEYLYEKELELYQQFNEYERERFLKLLQCFVVANEDQKDRIVGTAKEIICE